ncbi:hypothetical protein [Streptomyces platensis]|nr:hypothetical protein OG962_03790 [Streptomyces platensis]
MTASVPAVTLNNGVTMLPLGFGALEGKRTAGRRTASSTQQP